jgi:hypothetical protein
MRSFLTQWTTCGLLGASSMHCWETKRWVGVAAVGQRCQRYPADSALSANQAAFKEQYSTI